MELCVSLGLGVGKQDGSRSQTEPRWRQWSRDFHRTQNSWFDVRKIFVIIPTKRLGYVRNPRSLMEGTETLCRDDIGDLPGSPEHLWLRENANEIG